MRPNSFIATGIRPVGQDRHGEKWDRNQVRDYVIGDVLVGNHLSLRAKSMATDIEKATEILENSTALFDKVHKSLMDSQERVGQQSKVVSGQVRDAATKLADGLQKLEKVANFDRLERYVTLLERAASAMNQLAELEKAGKLEKIMQAVK